MSFNSDDFDFLKGGLHKVQMANVSTIILNLEDINLASTAVQIFGASASQGALPTQPILPLSSAFGASLATAYAASNCGVLRSSGPGSVYSIYAVNVSGAAKQYIQIHNTGVAAVSGAVPLRSFQVGAAGSDKTVGPNELTVLGESCSLGVTYAWSTTPGSFTPADGNNYQLEVRLK